MVSVEGGPADVCRTDKYFVCVSASRQPDGWLVQPFGLACWNDQSCTKMVQWWVSARLNWPRDVCQWHTHTDLTREECLVRMLLTWELCMSPLCSFSILFWRMYVLYGWMSEIRFTGKAPQLCTPALMYGLYVCMWLHTHTHTHHSTAGRCRGSVVVRRWCGVSSSKMCLSIHCRHAHLSACGLIHGVKSVANERTNERTYGEIRGVLYLLYTYHTCAVFYVFWCAWQLEPAGGCHALVGSVSSQCYCGIVAIALTHLLV